MAIRFRISHRVGAGCALVGAVLLLAGVFAVPVSASVGLGTADPFAVLAGTGVTNTGPTVINGDLGSCPTPAMTGFPPGTVNGTVHANDAVACGAQDDTTIAYNDAASRQPTTTYAGPTDLGGMTLVGGVYNSPSSLGITGTLTLDGQSNPDTTFIFQAGSTVITAPNSVVRLINGAQACNVFWQVGSSATLGVGSTLVGTVLALTSITANTNAGVQGRLLARNGAVTLDSNVITRAGCGSGSTTTTTGGTGGVTTSTTRSTAASTGITTTTRPAVTVTDLTPSGTSGSPTVTVPRSRTTSTRTSIPRTGDDSQRDAMLGSLALVIGFALTRLGHLRPRYIPRHRL